MTHTNIVVPIENRHIQSLAEDLIAEKLNQHTYSNNPYAISDLLGDICSNALAKSDLKKLKAGVLLDWRDDEEETRRQPEKAEAGGEEVQAEERPQNEAETQG